MGRDGQVDEDIGLCPRIFKNALQTFGIPIGCSMTIKAQGEKGFFGMLCTRGSIVWEEGGNVLPKTFVRLGRPRIAPNCRFRRQETLTKQIVQGWIGLLFGQITRSTSYENQQRLL
eukprot:scaffold4510_cov183-Amphora_coffeaeformis.AAC.5